MKLRPCLVCFFSLLNFYHSIFVTHHSSLITLNTTPVWHHHSIFFTLFVGPIPVTHCRVFFIFYFLFFTRKNTHQTYWKKKIQNRPKWKKEEEEKKKKKETQNRPKWKKEEEEEKKKETRTDRSERKKKTKKKKPRTANQEKKGKKKSKVVKSCDWVLFVGPLCVFNYNIAIELSYGNWKQPKCVFSFHNS